MTARDSQTKAKPKPKPAAKTRRVNHSSVRQSPPSDMGAEDESPGDAARSKEKRVPSRKPQP